MNVLERTTPVIVNITFDSIKSTVKHVIANTSSLDLKVGQQITLQIVSPIAPVPEWDANNDAVLDIADNGTKAVIKALKTGTSTIKFVVGNVIISAFTINVVISISPAVSVSFIKGPYRNQNGTVSI